MVGPIAEKSVWFFITLFLVFVSITQLSDFWVMSYGNWKHILGIFNFQNSIFNGNFVIKPTSWDPWSEQHHTQALLLMGLLQRLFTKADHTLKSHLHSLGFLQRLLMSCNFFLFLFPFLFIGFLGFGYPSSFLSFSSWFLGLLAIFFFFLLFFFISFH